MPTIERFHAWLVRDGLHVQSGFTGIVTGPLASIEEAVHYREQTMTEEQIAIVEEIRAELVTTEPKKPRKPRAAKALAPTDAGQEAAEAQAKAWEEEARKQLFELASFVIDDQIAMDAIGELQREAFEQRKQIEAQRQFLKAPSLEQGRRIDNMFKPAIGCWTSVEQACQKLQSDARATMRAAEDAALKAIEASGGQADAAALVVAHGGVRLEMPETSREVVSWYWSVVDEDKIPNQFKLLVVNTKLIDAMVETHQGGTDIPGIRVTRVVEVVNKAVRK